MISHCFTWMQLLVMPYVRPRPLKQYLDICHDDVIKWKHFPRYWPFVREIHRSPVNSPHKGQWRGALMFTLICARINGWVNNREAGDLRRYRAHYDVIVMCNKHSNYIRSYNPFLLAILWKSNKSDENILYQWASCQIRKIAGTHAPGMLGTFSPSPQVSDPDMNHGTCVTHVPWCMPRSLTSGFLWNRRWGKTFPEFPAHAQPVILRIW